MTAESGGMTRRDVLKVAGLAGAGLLTTHGLTSGADAGQRIALACGSDARGLAYALLELADRVTHAERPLDGLEISQPIAEKPANPIRSIARLFASDVEDKPWFNDRTFWRHYLTELANQRFNRF